jgi:regulator of cell morphogenesis and NO signaling
MRYVLELRVERVDGKRREFTGFGAGTEPAHPPAVTSNPWESMLDSSTNVANLVLDHSECGPVFQRHRIDFCCRGNVSIEAACAQKGIDVKALLAELSQAIEQRKGAPKKDLRALSTAALTAHIVLRHHEYLREALPFIQQLASKVSRVHGGAEPRLRELDAVVDALGAALLPHLDHEEQVFFPALNAKAPDRAFIARELGTMHAEHLTVGDLLGRVRTITDDFQVSEGACHSYRTLFSELEQLEGDVLEHVHVENHVLMPRFGG